jgi:hypothetical protein
MHNPLRLSGTRAKRKGMTRIPLWFDVLDLGSHTPVDRAAPLCVVPHLDQVSVQHGQELLLLHARSLTKQNLGSMKKPHPDATA